MYKLSKYLIPAGGILMMVLIPLLVSAQLPTPTSPVGGQALTLNEVRNLIQGIARFIIIVAVIIAVIAIVISGIIWVTAGSDQSRIDKARGWFKNGIIGALIVLAVGVILQTLAGVVARTFFGTFTQ